MTVMGLVIPPARISVQILSILFLIAPVIICIYEAPFQSIGGISLLTVRFQDIINFMQYLGFFQQILVGLYRH